MSAAEKKEQNYIAKPPGRKENLASRPKKSNANDKKFKGKSDTRNNNSVENMRTELNARGVTIDIAGPGQHVPVVERMGDCFRNSGLSFSLSVSFVQLLEHAALAQQYR